MGSENPTRHVSNSYRRQGAKEIVPVNDVDNTIEDEVVDGVVAASCQWSVAIDDEVAIPSWSERNRTAGKRVDGHSSANEWSVGGVIGNAVAVDIIEGKWSSQSRKSFIAGSKDRQVTGGKELWFELTKGDQRRYVAEKARVRDVLRSRNDVVDNMEDTTVKVIILVLVSKWKHQTQRRDLPARRCCWGKGFRW
jgi:hypothetical protein